jgi:hypothetical protein
VKKKMSRFEQETVSTVPLRQMPFTATKWASRFIWAAVVQGLIAAIVTVLIVQPLSYFNINPYYSPSKVIAGGGGGTWMFTGYILYLVVGVVAVAVTALFYFYFEGVLGRAYKDLTSYLAWGHLILLNVGVAGSMLFMVWGGYNAGAAAAPVASGGLGYTALQIHENILGPLVNPIGGLVLVAVLGAVLGGLGFIIQSRKR